MLALALFPTLASAQSTILGFPPGVFQNRAAMGAGTAAYVGPGDIATFIDWYGFRCYSNAFSGPIAGLVNAGNTLGTQLQCTGSSGNGAISAVVSSSACTWVTGNACSTLATTCAVACHVQLMYSQPGNLNCTGGTALCNPNQNTDASRPTFTTSCVNGHYCMSSSGTQNLASGGRSLATQAQPVTASIVFNGSATGAAYTLYTGAGNNNAYNNIAGDEVIYAGTALQLLAASAGSWHGVHNVFNGASSTLDVDNTRITAAASPGTIGLASGGAYILGANNSGAGTTLWAEGGYTASALSTAVQDAITANQAAYYCSGGSFPC